MRPFIDSQALAGRFNEDEAVWRRYRQKRDLRRLRGSPSPFPEEVLDRSTGSKRKGNAARDGMLEGQSRKRSKPRRI